MAECGICCSRLNDKRANKQVECPYCHFRCCQSCFQRYLLGITQQNCMSCRNTFSDKFLQAVLPKAFVNGELNTHKQNIFMMKEHERLKLYEHLVPKYKRLQKDLLQIKKLSEEIRKLEFKHKRGKLTNKTKDEEIAKLKEKKQTIIDNGFHLSDNPDVPIKVQTKTVLGPKCPVEGCKGHTVVNGANYRCQMCEAEICKKCLCNLRSLKSPDEEHKCDPSDVKSLEFILRDSKPCPGCGMMIFRESGCPAMFCVNCNVSFNWYSLQVEAPSHNPHYYEWLEKKYTTNPFYSQEDLLLEDQTQLPDYEILTNAIRHYGMGLCDFTLECHRLANELKDLIPMTVYDETEIETLRVKYLLGEITKAKFLEKIMILQTEADYYDHQRESIGTVWELLRTEFWRLILKEYTLNDFAKNAFEILNAYAKDQVETADKYGKKYIQTKKTFGDFVITYVIVRDFEDRMRVREERNIPIVNQDNDPWSDYDYYSDEY